MKKTHKVILIPCEDKQGSLHISNGDQHLYFISNDEIKEGDWYYDTNHNAIGKYDSSAQIGKKIVATTDKSLNDNIKPQNREFVKALNSIIPEIPESFIQAYIKSYNDGKAIEEVDLEMDISNCKGLC